MAADGDIPRWTRRRDEFGRMVDLLERTDAIRRDRELTEAEEAGMVQFFEMSVELAWKTLALLMRHDGVSLPAMAPVPVFREAARLGYVDRPDDWMAAVERRNLMSHTYDPAAFRLLVADIGVMFLPLMARLRTMLRDMADR
ncbi:nucleotidyltransferase substrate binding protein [Sphingomonas sp. RP10(2022)]|uniref:Nucleotidyltransferase substrate binding protein n=1 Tax=Sphingomonas liriopis TaxID=2949094 RepID=A0A9X2KRF2_9SPHN|nr:nucleotidyltransferase substrate binding protein [Sphingomonas liriopis]MCP3735987.1 nucleotidyltransferase substrate binding protein [Sphingomonas liriopis]